jgi:UDP:flavonoid glycosyltransferase YjiC (YdhE family)
VVRSDSADEAGWGTISDAIAARVPVIAVGAGWSEELPKHVVLPLAADSTAEELAERIEAATRDDALRAAVREAQDAYAAEHSFARVAERYAELLDL